MKVRVLVQRAFLRAIQDSALGSASSVFQIYVTDCGTMELDAWITPYA